MPSTKYYDSDKTYQTVPKKEIGIFAAQLSVTCWVTNGSVVNSAAQTNISATFPGRWSSSVDTGWLLSFFWFRGKGAFHGHTCIA
jgi:hypothetical protein